MLKKALIAPAQPKRAETRCSPGFVLASLLAAAAPAERRILVRRGGRVRTAAFLNILRPSLMDQRGFTLLEVLIALAILALGLPILLGLRNFDLDLHARAGDITAATMLAQEKLMEAEVSPVFPLGETTGDFRNPPPGAQSTFDTQNRADKYRWKRVITTTLLPSVREVKIQIIWPQGLTDEMIEVSTYVFSSSSS